VSNCRIRLLARADLSVDGHSAWASKAPTKTLSIFPFFHYFAKMPPLTKSKLKSCSPRITLVLVESVEVIGMNNFAKKAKINNPEIAR